MAIDTAAKRFSAINHGSPWRGLGTLPDGTIGASDRLSLAWLYSGIAAGSGAPVAAYGRMDYTMPRAQLAFTMAEHQMVYTVPKERLEFTGREN